MVCVVDDDSHTIQFLSGLFDAAALPVRAFDSAADFLQQWHPQGPCCLVTDPGKGADGFELQRVLTGSHVRMIFLAGRADVPMCARAMREGAVDFFTKPVEAEILLEAVNRALAHSRVVCSEKAARSAALAKFSTLTSREFAVMQRVVAGLLNKQIAAEFGTAEKTIKVHRGRVMRKTGAVSVAELVRLAITAGIPGLVCQQEAC